MLLFPENARCALLDLFCQLCCVLSEVSIGFKRAQNLQDSLHNDSNDAVCGICLSPAWHQDHVPLLIWQGLHHILQSSDITLTPRVNLLNAICQICSAQKSAPSDLRALPSPCTRGETKASTSTCKSAFGMTRRQLTAEHHPVHCSTVIMLSFSSISVCIWHVMLLRWQRKPCPIQSTDLMKFPRYQPCYSDMAAISFLMMLMADQLGLNTAMDFPVQVFAKAGASAILGQPQSMT